MSALSYLAVIITLALAVMAQQWQGLALVVNATTFIFNITAADNWDLLQVEGYGFDITCTLPLTMYGRFCEPMLYPVTGENYIATTLYEPDSPTKGVQVQLFFGSYLQYQAIGYVPDPADLSPNSTFTVPVDIPVP
ncbi:hypothetical protein F5Y16DRAFT_373981 [Xylariaceae sp. FL0255]|nr:hypothetical protein F5Y16DRAFT_373981 [Xylariaceae sp. FL0255]